MCDQKNVDYRPETEFMSGETGDYDSDLSFKFDDDGYSSNEAILAEWGQIRHRFLSDISGPVQRSITCQAGVLGSIRRCRDHGYYKKERRNPIQPDEKELYLRKFWNGESLDSKEITPESSDDERAYSRGSYSLMAKNMVFKVSM